MASKDDQRARETEILLDHLAGMMKRVEQKIEGIERKLNDDPGRI
jgi:hypothetical protein